MGYSRRFLGLCTLVGVVVIWVGSAEIEASIFNEQSYNKPFFLTYFDTSMFAVYLFGFACSAEWRRFVSAGRRLSGSEGRTYQAVQLDTALTLPCKDVEKPNKLSLAQVCKISMGFGILWFIANYTFNLSLTLTSPASSTLLSSTSSSFTLLLGAFMKVESLTVIKILGVLLCTAGAVCVNVSDQDGSTEEHSAMSELFGDLLALFSAMMYAAYLIFLKVNLKNENSVHMPMFFGFLGLFNLLLLWPLFLLLHYTGVEEFQWPNTTSLFLSLTVNALIGTVISDYLWLLSVLLTSPIISTVGLSLSIPLSMVADVVLGHRSSYPALYITGAVVILLGFFCVNVPEQARSGENNGGNNNSNFTKVHSEVIIDDTAIAAMEQVARDEPSSSALSSSSSSSSPSFSSSSSSSSPSSLSSPSFFSSLRTFVTKPLNRVVT